MDSASSTVAVAETSYLVHFVFSGIREPQGLLSRHNLRRNRSTPRSARPGMTAASAAVDLNEAIAVAQRAAAAAGELIRQTFNGSKTVEHKGKVPCTCSQLVERRHSTVNTQPTWLKGMEMPAVAEPKR